MTSQPTSLTGVSFSTLGARRSRVSSRLGRLERREAQQQANLDGERKGRVQWWPRQGNVREEMSVRICERCRAGPVVSMLGGPVDCFEMR